MSVLASISVASPGAARLRARPLTPRQEAVLDDLERLVLREGFRDLTVGDLAARLNCSRRTLYELAASKDDLVVLVIRRYFEGFMARGLAAAARHRKPGRQLEALASGIVEELAGLGEQFSRDVVTTPRTAEVVAELAARFVEAVNGIVEHGVETGDFRRVNPRLVGEAMLGIVSRLQDPASLERLGLGYAEAARQVASLVLDGLRAR